MEVKVAQLQEEDRALQSMLRPLATFSNLRRQRLIAMLMWATLIRTMPAVAETRTSHQVTIKFQFKYLDSRLGRTLVRPSSSSTWAKYASMLAHSVPQPSTTSLKHKSHRLSRATFRGIEPTRTTLLTLIIRSISSASSQIWCRRNRTCQALPRCSRLLAVECRTTWATWALVEQMQAWWERRWRHRLWISTKLCKAFSLSQRIIQACRRKWFSTTTYRATTTLVIAAMAT